MTPLPPLHPLPTVLLLAFLTGVVAGMRSMLPLAALGITLWRHPELVPPAAPARWFALPIVVIVFVLLTLGELIGDKLPSTPNRTALAPFLGRLITGGVGGAIVAQTSRDSGWIGAGAAVLGAAIATILIFRLRQRVDRALRVRDAWVGLGEDIIAIVLAGIIITVLIGR